MKKIFARKVNDQTILIWNSDWLNNRFKTLIDNFPIIDEQIIQDIDVVINSTEVQLFKIEYDDEPEFEPEYDFEYEPEE